MPGDVADVFTVDQLGIKDIDGYGHVWYGNYLKFFERAMQVFLGGGTVCRVEHLKYKRSIPWGAADSRIESYLVGRPAPGRALVYQRWCVGHEDDCTFSICLSQVVLPPGVGESVPVMEGGERLRQGRAGGREPKLAMAVKNLQTGAVKPQDEAEGVIGTLPIRRHVFADMLSEAPGSTTMRLVDVTAPEPAQRALPSPCTFRSLHC